MSTSVDNLSSSAECGHFQFGNDVLYLICTQVAPTGDIGIGFHSTEGFSADAMFDVIINGLPY